jgi:transcriptional regulator with XRE-family HTH domain
VPANNVIAPGDEPVRRPGNGPTEAEEQEGREALGERLRAFRQMRRTSLRATAGLAGISPGFLSELERGRANASIGTLRRIADALGLAVADLFSEDRPVEPTVVRREARPEITTAGGSRKYLLSQKPLRNFEAYAGEFDPGATTGDEAYVHGDAQELFLVVSGSVRLELDGVAHDLHAGDSIEYSTTVPHRVVNTSDELAEVLWLISPPTT